MGDALFLLLLVVFLYVYAAYDTIKEREDGKAAQRAMRRVSRRLDGLIEYDPDDLTFRW